MSITTLFISCLQLKYLENSAKCNYPEPRIEASNLVGGLVAEWNQEEELEGLPYFDFEDLSGTARNTSFCWN